MDLRDIFIFAAVVVIAPTALRKPQMGMLAWLWISIMNPHKESFGFTYNMPLLDGIAGLTILGCIINWKDRSQLPFHPVLKVLVAFYIWCTATTIFAVHPKAAWIDWEEYSKTLLLIFLMFKFLNKKHWIVAATGIFILGLSFTALKGGLFTIITGGAHRVYGPPTAVWGSNNGVSLAMIMLIPMAIGFAKVFEKPFYRLCAYGIGFLAFASVMGTQSRGGLVGLLAIGGAMVLRTRKKMLALTLVPIILATGFMFMPDTWHKRMSTIASPMEEGSAKTRLIQWQYAIDISLERPLFGNGFEAFFHRPYFYKYVSDKDANRAVHSNIFQILGEQGYIGLAMWILMLAIIVISNKRHADMAKGRKDLEWAASLLSMMQFSVIGFAANGLTLNLAYLDLYYYVMIFSTLMIAYIRQELGLSEAPERVAAYGVRPHGPGGQDFGQPLRRGRLSSGRL